MKTGIRLRSERYFPITRLFDFRSRATGSYLLKGRCSACPEVQHLVTNSLHPNIIRTNQRWDLKVNTFKTYEG